MKRFIEKSINENIEELKKGIITLKDIADEVTLSNEDDGIARSLYKHMPEIGDSL